MKEKRQSQGGPGLDVCICTLPTYHFLCFPFFSPPLIYLIYFKGNVLYEYCTLTLATRKRRACTPPSCASAVGRGVCSWARTSPFTVLLQIDGERPSSASPTPVGGTKPSCTQKHCVMFQLYLITLLFFFLDHRGGETSKFMLIQGTACWVSVCSRPSLTYAVNTRIFLVHVLILSKCTQTRPQFNVPSERRRK